MEGRPHESVERQALRGVPWTVLGYTLTRGLSLVGTLVLARLLTPEQIGLVLTGMVVIAALNLLSDSGLGVSLILRDELSERMIGTIFTCMITAGLVFGAAVAAAAGPIAALFGSPELADIIPFLAVTVVFTSARFFFVNYLQRLLLFERRFFGMFAQPVGYVGVAVPAAAAGAGIWSLVAGQIAGTLLSVIILWLVTPERIRPAFDRGHAVSAYRDSRAFLAQAGTAFVADNGHSLAVAGFLGPRAMGLYQMSFRLTELPAKALAGPVASATFPAFARLKGEQERTRTAFLTSLQYVVFAGLPGVVALGALASPFALGVLGPRWADMAPVLAMLAAWGAVRVLGACLGWFVNATGGAGWLARINVVRLVITLPAVFVLAATTGSTVAVAAVLVADAALEVGLLVAFVHRRMSIRVSELWSAVRIPFWAAAVMGALAVAVSLSLEEAGAGPLARLGAGSAVGLVAYIGIVGVLDRPFLARGLALARRSVSRGGTG